MPLALKKTGEYRRVYDSGKKLVGRYLVLFYMPGEGPSRVGITVSGKLGGACARNRIKRRLREALRMETAEEGPGRMGALMVFVAKGRIGAAPFKDITRDIRTLLSKIKI